MSERWNLSDRGEARRFAQAWADAWNRRDLDAVLAHFADDVVFESPKAVAVTGMARVEGKGALRAYWHAALQNVASLRFEVEDVLLDAEVRCVVVVYRSSINGAALRVAEHLQWGADGRVCYGAAYHGVPLASAAAQ